MDALHVTMESSEFVLQLVELSNQTTITKAYVVHTLLVETQHIRVRMSVCNVMQYRCTLLLDDSSKRIIVRFVAICQAPVFYKTLDLTESFLRVLLHQHLNDLKHLRTKLVVHTKLLRHVSADSGTTAKHIDHTRTVLYAWCVLKNKRDKASLIALITDRTDYGHFSLLYQYLQFLSASHCSRKRWCFYAAYTWFYTVYARFYMVLMGLF